MEVERVSTADAVDLSGSGIGITNGEVGVVFD